MNDTSTTATGAIVAATSAAGSASAVTGTNTPGGSAGFLGDGNVGVYGRLATDRPQVFKMYGAYTLKTNTQIGAFIYVGSGTPLSSLVNTLDLYPLLVEGRGDMGRTPTLSRTDLLVSHELKLKRAQRMRFELNILNIFNQKTATHIFNFINKGAPGGSTTIPADAIDMSSVNLTKGYDYRALILEAAAARERPPGQRRRTLGRLRRELRRIRERDYFPPPERELAVSELRRQSHCRRLADPSRRNGPGPRQRTQAVEPGRDRARMT